MQILRRLVVISLFVVAVSVTAITESVHSQAQGTMNRKERSDAATVLKALTRNWALVDYAPEIDFLVFVNEDRDELTFYPKKSLIKMMEQSGLIENLDEAGSLARTTDTRYEAYGSGWKEITEPGAIVFQHRVTSKGQEFLRDAPRLIGSVPKLRVASSPAEIPTKPLKVVIYDGSAIQKLVGDFEKEAKSQIGVIFALSTDREQSVSSKRALHCGPRLWQKLESQAKSNGLTPSGSLVVETHSFDAKTSMTTVEPSEEIPLAPTEMPLFTKTLREVFGIDGLPIIRRAKINELSKHPYLPETANSDVPTPDLAGLVVQFIVEANHSRFVVFVESVPDTDFKHFGPAVTRIELK